MIVLQVIKSSGIRSLFLNLSIMKKIRINTAGIDIGAKQFFVAVEGREVKSFFTFTEDIADLVVYLSSNKVKSAAMEATGVYWYILYDMLRDAGFDVWLVDGRSTKQVPGRKTDVKDCQWIQQLHSYGLLNRCFIPGEAIQELRTFERLREDHIRSAAMHINHMQKSLVQMNIRLKEVISQIHGASGMKMIRAILSGERDPERLAALCHTKISRHKKDEVVKSLKGHYSANHLFALQQAVECYDFYQGRIADCDRKIEQCLQRMDNGKGYGHKDNTKRKPIRHHKPDIEKLDRHLLNIFEGRDATVLPGISDYNWLQLLSEIGTDLGKWKTEKHFTSWLGLAPKQHNSGKKNRNYRAKGAPKAGLIFKQAAAGLLNSKKIALGVFGRKIRAKKGGAVAIRAVARKLAVLYYKLLTKGLEYVERGIKAYEEKLLEQKQRNILKAARNLGMELVEIQHVG